MCKDLFYGSPLPCISGTLDLNLHAMPEPASSASSLDMLPEPEPASGASSHSLDPEHELEPASSAFCCCCLAMLKPASEEENKVVDLFKKKRMKGWWPVYKGTELAVSQGKEQFVYCHFVYSIIVLQFSIHVWFITRVFTFFFGLRSCSDNTS